MTVVTIAEPEAPDAFAEVAELVSIQPSHGPKPPSTGRPPASICPVADCRPLQKSTESQGFSPGVAYYGYRWFDSATGRWPSRDPIEEKGGLNLYGFVGNNGFNQWDLLGLEPWARGQLVEPNWTPSPQNWGLHWSDAWLHQKMDKAAIAANLVSRPAAVNMRHYLNGAGTPLTWDLGEIAEHGDEQALEDILTADLLDAVAFADGLEDGVIIRSAQWTDHDLNSRTWFWALGTTRWAGSGKFLKKGAEKALLVTYHHWDPYDFREGSMAPAGPGLTDGDWHRFHRIGFGKEFLVRGKTSTVILRWCGELPNNPSLDGPDVDFEDAGIHRVVEVAGGVGPVTGGGGGRRRR